MAAATEDGKRQRRVAIACQGCGSHTAFTAGVLKRLLGADELDGYQVAGLSGTSGGAVCALLWSCPALASPKLLARERVTWTLRTRGEHGASGPSGSSGQAEAEFRDGKVTSLRLGPLPQAR